MAFLTLFSAPKSFTVPHIALIQHNAVRSWKRLEDVDVILIGDEPGMREAARDLGVHHIPDVRRNASGTPLISSMFELARHASDSRLLGIINTDIVLFEDLIAAARTATQLTDRFVLLSRRWDLHLEERLDFANGWAGRIRSAAREAGRLHRPAGSDYFVFPRECYLEVPDFAIGRAGWDNWMIYRARKSGWTVVDATPSVMVIHQDHDYAHLPGGRTHHTLPETDENIRLAGGIAAIRYTVLDATRELTGGRLVRPAPSLGRAMRALELFLRSALRFLPENRLEQAARPKRWLKWLRRRLK